MSVTKKSKQKEMFSQSSLKLAENELFTENEKLLCLSDKEKEFTDEYTSTNTPIFNIWLFSLI
jgi:hypothetical protein